MTKATAFSLTESIKKLEELEQYFQKPNMDFEVAITKHAEALQVAEDIKQYLATVESSLEKLGAAQEAE